MRSPTPGTWARAVVSQPFYGKEHFWEVKSTPGSTTPAPCPALHPRTAECPRPGQQLDEHGLARSGTLHCPGAHGGVGEGELPPLGIAWQGPVPPHLYCGDPCPHTCTMEALGRAIPPTVVLQGPMPLPTCAPGGGF